MTVAVHRTMSSTSAPTSSSFTSGVSLDKDDFVKLLVAQMKHQDPLNPQDGTQMATQLAQFSSVEQLMNINSTLAGQGGTNAGLATALENSAAIGLIGKNVSVSTNTVTVGGDAIPPFATELPGAGTLVVNLVDASGRVVRTQDMGRVAAGRHALDIRDLADGLSNGTYTISLAFTNAAGATSAPATLATAHVDGVQFGPNGLVLRSGTRTYPLSGVTSVDAAN